jgi:hypothetical protein
LILALKYVATCNDTTYNTIVAEISIKYYSNCMGTLRVLTGLAMLALATVTTTDCGMVSDRDPSCTMDIDEDYIGVMGTKTRDFLMDYGYVPDGKCGTVTASFGSYDIWIGDCRGTYIEWSDKRAYVSLADDQQVGSTVSAPSREELPTANQLIRDYPAYVNC